MPELPENSISTEAPDGDSCIACVESAVVVVHFRRRRAGHSIGLCKHDLEKLRDLLTAELGR